MKEKNKQVKKEVKKEKKIEKIEMLKTIFHITGVYVKGKVYFDIDNKLKKQFVKDKVAKEI